MPVPGWYTLGMFYIYHNVPEEMIGTRLMPLTEMAKIRPDLSGKYTEKYKGREEIMERRVPLLNCLWNEVVQFLPFHPGEAFGLQVQMGILPKMPHYEFFEIPLELLDPEKTAVYFKTAPGEENAQIKMLKDVDFALIQDMPQATKDYYQTLVGSGELPFNYQFVPHVLYKGILDVSSVKTITL